MSSAFLFQQAKAFGPGRLIGVIRDFGIPIQHRKLFAGDEVPTDLEEIRAAIFLSGPMKVGDVGSAEHPFLAKEVELLQRLIHHDRPILAIGLGAQLLAHAAGAKVGPCPTPEFGWGAVTFPFPGGNEPIVMGLSDGVPMFHCHTEMFELPRLPAPANPPPGPPPPSGSALLSSTKACKNQAFRFKNRLFGFQYHIELTIHDIEAIVAGSGQAHPEVAAETEKNYSRYSRLGDRIVRNFVQFTKTY